MAVWSITELSSVTHFDRIDGEYYLPSYLSNHDVLSSIETVPLPQRFHVSDGNHLSVSKYFSDSAKIPYFRGQDVNDFFLENASPVGIPERVYNSSMMQRSHFQEADVLLSIVGTIGSLSLVPQSIGSATGSCKIAILRSRGEYSPFVLAAFLLSKYGQLQIKRNTRGAVQMGLILKDLIRIRVPLFSGNSVLEIEELVKNAIVSNNQSKEFHDQSQQLLESELGFDKLSFQKSTGYTTRFSSIELSDTFSAIQIDAQCFATEAIFYKEWLLKHTQCDLLGHLLQNTAKGRQQNETIDGTADYCSIKHMNGRELTNVGKCFPANGTPLATANDLLLAITGATIGKIGILKRYSQLTFSGDLLRLRVKPEINPHYLLFVLDHPLGQVQFNRWITGSTNGHLAPRDIKRVLVPRLKEGIEMRIATLVEESLTKRVESESLLERAKTRVEQLIEEAVQA